MKDGAPSLVVGGIGLLQTLRDGVHLGLSLFEGDTGLEAAYAEVVVIAADGGFGGCECFGDPHLGVAGLVHRWTHNADDGVGLAIKVYGFSDGAGIGGVVRSPEFVTENDFVVLSGAVLFGAEDASVDGFDAEDGEEAGGDGACADGFGFSGAGDVKVCAGVEGHGFEDVVLFLPVEEVGGGDGEDICSGKAGLRRSVPDLNDAIDVAEGEWLEQDLVDDAKDGGVGADAEGHDDGGDERETGIFPEQSKSEAKVLQEADMGYLVWVESNSVAMGSKTETQDYQGFYEGGRRVGVR